MPKQISIDAALDSLNSFKDHGRDIGFSLHLDIRDAVSHFSAEFGLSKDESKKLMLRVLKHFLSNKTHRIS